jgi:hypothetical protein
LIASVDRRTSKVSASPSDFKVTTVRRLVEAVRGAGLEIGRIEFNKAAGTIVVVPVMPGEKPAAVAAAPVDG